jgi:hypothetical protein
VKWQLRGCICEYAINKIKNKKRRNRKKNSEIGNRRHHCSAVGSGTGRDPDGTFRDPEPEIPDFWTTRDFSGSGILRDKSRKIPPDLFSKFPGFPGFFGIFLDKFLALWKQKVVKFKIYIFNIEVFDVFEAESAVCELKFTMKFMRPLDINLCKI